MTDSTGQQIDRYVRGELTPEEARELAQQSLADPEVFEDLTASALATAALAAQGSEAKLVRFPRKARFIIAGAAAAAAIVLVSLYSIRWLPSHQNQRHEKPALASSASPGQPILLASGLQPEPNSAQVFRSPEPDSRAPKQAGSIVSIEDGLAAINLGSLDGLAKGTEVQAYQHERPVGRVRVTVVFRERARGQILAGSQIHVSDEVRPSAAIYLDALLQQVDALSGRGDADAARRVAEQADEWAQTANVPPAGKQKALERLAILEYQGGSLPLAEKHYEAALDIPIVSLTALNNLAVLRMLRGDYDSAEAPLNQVISTSPKTSIAYARSLNNLAVLAELRGDRRKAQALYTDALRAAADSPLPERQALETNLARIRGVR